MTFDVHVILGGLEDYVIWILTIAVCILQLTLGHAIILEQLFVLMETLLIHVSVEEDLLVITAQKMSMNVKTVPVKMVEIVPTTLVDLNAPALRDSQDILVV